MKKVILGLGLLSLGCLAVGLAYASGMTPAAGATGSTTTGNGVGFVARTVITNLSDVAKLITAGAYVAGMAFAVGAVVKFKGHKENPTQIPIGTPIALLFVGAALIFIPTVFSLSGATIFASGTTANSTLGVSSFAKAGG